MSFNLPSVCHNLLPHLMHGDHEVAFDEEPLLTKDKEADDSVVVSTSTDTEPHFDQVSVDVPLRRPSLHLLGRTDRPTPELQRQVAAILQDFDSGPPEPRPDDLLSAQHVYPTWCVLLFATVGPGYGTSIDFQTGAEHPNAGLHYLPAMIAGLGQAGDSKITWDGVRGGLASHRQELEDCHVYLNAVSGLQALAALKTHRASDRALVEQARARFEKLVQTHTATFQRCLEPGYLVPRCMIAGVRDVGLGGLSLLKTIPSAAVNGMATSGPLTGAAKDLATTLPYLSSALTILTGVFHIAHAILEGLDAGRKLKALSKAEQFDKNVFEAHGAGCPELLELLEHRHQWRELARLDANLLDLHGWIRGIYGGTSLGSAAVGTALAALGGAALFGAAAMGIPGLVGIFLAGAYMMWYGVRANVRNENQKRHEKACRTIAALHERSADKMPGLSRPRLNRPIQAIARGFVGRLLALDTRQQTRQLLIDLGLSPAEVDAAIEGNSESLIPRIEQLGSQATLSSETEGLRRFHACSDKPASKQLTVLERWMDLGHKPADITAPNDLARASWTQYLAPGADMGDLRKSSLTPQLIRRHWNDAGFQPALRRQLCTNEFHAMETPDDAWDLLEIHRNDMHREAKARADVAGWINAGQWGNVELCLHDDLATRAHQKVLQDDYGLLPRQAGSVLAVLQQRATTLPLQTDTIASFMAIYKASDAAGKRLLLPKVKALVRACARSMPKDEGVALRTALGISADKGLHKGNVDAVLQSLQKFLAVSEKLRGQTLPKVVASLHTYPTDGHFPKALCHLAALRELRMRCETKGCDLGRPDVKYALMQAKALSSKKLHTRTIGAGEGGGVFGFGGYRLNKQGAFIRSLFEQCMSSKPSAAPKQKENIPGASPGQRENIQAVQQQSALFLSDHFSTLMVACKACKPADKGAFLPQVRALVDAAAQGMPEDEHAALCAALGIPDENGINAGNVDAVLQALQKFLIVSEKLPAQTLSKVVASLHTYPTDRSIPQALCQLAALRELRQRCEAKGRSLAEPEVLNALVLAKALSTEKLHGNGFLGLGRPRLNEKGAYLHHLFESCLGGHPPKVSMSSTSLQQLWNRSNDSAYRAALMQGANQMMGREPTAPDAPDAQAFANLFAQYSTPGALQKALRSKDDKQREAAFACLDEMLTAAETRIGDSLGGEDCVIHLKAYFRLEKLKHGSNPPSHALGVISADRLDTYRSALAWRKGRMPAWLRKIAPAWLVARVMKAQNKNIQAIQAELKQLRGGQKAQAHSFWSAKFLTQHGASATELQKMQALYPRLEVAKSYKELATRLQTLSRMSVPQLRESLRQNPERAWHWLQVEFKTRGLPPPTDKTHALNMLRAAAKNDGPDLLVALSTLKSNASRLQGKNLAPQLWREADRRSTAEEDKGDSPGLTRSNSAILIPRNRLSLSIENG